MPAAKVTEITTSSEKSFQDAIQRGMAQASQTLDRIQSTWLKEQKITCWGDRPSEYRVTLKVTSGLKGVAPLLPATPAHIPRVEAGFTVHKTK